ncbi:hypothetical protein FVE85_4087 [Porphyridium purpureum]|uniref:C2 NT-type domain-containing protein n=1 Tax=Porphyridium purpureum TaxID=35688 RepID=A0A5J4YTE6_PORPP|nr:hypothetical protein FVE85_4087 [Porphyridium purpureum]|eukprot:POR1618..scf229_5
MSSVSKGLLSPREKSASAVAPMSPREPSKSFALRNGGLMGRSKSRTASNAQREGSEFDYDGQAQSNGELTRNMSRSGRFGRQNQDGGSSRNLGKTASSRNLLKNAVRNKGRLGQHPSQFELTIFVEKIDKLPLGVPKGDYVVCMTRSDKTYSTKPFKVLKKGDPTVIIEDTITATVTLFRQNPDDDVFCEKQFKFSMRPHQDGKKRVKDRSVDKVVLDVAQHVQIPSGSRRLGANMVQGAQLVLKLDSTFLGAGSGTRSSAGSVVAPSEFDAASSAGGQDSSLDDLDGLEDDLEDGQAQGLERSNSKTGSKRLAKLTSILRRGDNSELERLKAQLKVLEDENQVLEKENDALICSLAARTQPSGGADSNVGALGALMRRTNPARNADDAELKKLIRENQALKLEVKELRKVLEAEKEADEIVDELKDAKLELAVAYLEKEQMHLELMTLMRKKRPQATG